MSTLTTNLTDEQARAIYARDVSVALSAGAGCGKTYVLVERFLAQLEPAATSSRPADGAATNLSELVAITFTERAAREMRERIRARCYARLQAAPGEQQAYWLDLMRSLDAARVSTIHSFCTSLLRSHAVEAALDPRFAVLEQAQADTLLTELVDDRLREGLAEQDEAMLDLVAEFGLVRLRKMFRTLIGRRQEIDFEVWRCRTPEEQVARWESFHRGHSIAEALGRVERSAAAVRVLEMLAVDSMSNDDLMRRKAELTERIANLSCGADPAAALAELREAALLKGSGGKKAWPDETQYEAFKKGMSELRSEIDKAVRYLEFDPEAALPAARLGLCLLGFTESITEAYDDAKRDLRLLDFNDLLIRARRLLTNPAHDELRRRLSSQIRLLLVDEFQDTDPLQVELVEALCGSGVASGKLFFVGDFKQSIYRFRGARPEVFRALEEKTPEAGRLPLTLNFRSQPAILDFVNATFCDCFTTSYEPLRAHRPQTSPTPAIEFLWAQSDEKPNAKGAKQRARQREADWIARCLRAMLDGGEPIVGDEAAAARGEPAVRPVEPGDIAILFRALSDVELYEEALRQYGIDYYLVGGHAFYAQQEIYDLLNLLRAVASPSDEISLAGVLRSPFFSLTDESLYWLAQHEEGLGCGLMAEKLPEAMDDDQRSSATFAAGLLRSLRADKDRMPVATLVNEALARTGYDAVLLAEFMGERKLANLRKLVDQARASDRTGVFGLDDFIVQLSQFVAEQPDEPLAATHPESTEVVRLMTIHQAKGLEFPIVVVPDLDRAGREQTGSVAFTDALGPLVRAKGPDGKEPCCGLDLHALAGREEEEQERARLFYVACTRAADALILSGGVFASNWPQGPWAKLLAERFDLATGALACTLPAGVAEPEIKVTMAQPTTGAGRKGKPRQSDLEKLLVKASDLAASGDGRVPKAVGPVAVDFAARRQFSFSRLSGELHDAHYAAEAKVETPDADAAGTAPRIDPLGLGTLVHEMLEQVRFGETNDAAALAARLAPSHLGDDPAGEAAAGEMVARFLDSDEAQRLADARQVHRELEFLLAWPPEAARAGGRYLQGYIDCLYEDAAHRWHVLDYKTNRVSAEQVAAAATGYEIQMFVYALAVERVLGQPPEELTLYFLRPGVAHRFAWNDAARERVVEQVNRAMARLVE